MTILCLEFIEFKKKEIMKALFFILFIAISISFNSFSAELVEVKQVLNKAVKTLINDKNKENFWNYSFYQSPHVISMYFISLKIMDLENASKLNKEKLKNILLNSQNANGYWDAIYDKQFSQIQHSQSDFDATILNYFTLKLFGLSENEPVMIKAAEFIKQNGGILAADTQVKALLAMTGNTPWSIVEKLNKLILNPLSVVSIDKFSNWIATSLSAFSYLRTIKSVKPLNYNDMIISLDELWTDQTALKKFRSQTAFAEFKNIKRSGNGKKIKGMAWIKELLKAQKTSSMGAIKGDTTTTLISLLALDSLMKYEEKNIKDNQKYDFLTSAYTKIKKEGLSYLEKMYIENDNKELNYRGATADGRYWDTILASLALLEADFDKSELKNSAEFIVKNQHASGGFGYGLGYEKIPDTDDTAAAIILLSKFGNHYADSIRAATDYILKMQNSDNGFATFNPNRDGNKLYHLLIRGYDRRIQLFDYSSNDITGHAIEGLVAAKPYFSKKQYKKKLKKINKAIKKGLKYLDKNRDYHNDWSYWRGRWSVNYIYGTQAVIGAKEKSKQLDLDSKDMQSTLAWLEARQNKDGGYGETYLSDKNPALAGRGASTPTQTAWALMSLLSLGKVKSKEVADAIDYLIKNFKEESLTWNDDDQVTGTGIPNNTYFVYPGYPKIFPIIALARYIKLLTNNKEIYLERGATSADK